MAFLIGVDVGSQSVKACVTDHAGRRLAVADAPCALSHPRGGWAEQNPEHWQAALATSVRAACAEAGVSAADDATIALACQVDGIVATGAGLLPLRPAIIWMDRRATTQTEALEAAVGADRLRSITGLNPDSSHSGPKAMWVRDNEPDVYARARWLGSVSAYMNAWLTGEMVHDHANASSSLLYDVSERRWSAELLDASGLDGDKLPRIAAAHEVVGCLRPQVASQLGLRPSTRVVCGTGDDHAATLGAGGSRPGTVIDVTGTAEPVTAPAERVVLDPAGLVETHAHAVDGTLLVENPGFVSGGSVRWLAQVTGRTQAELLVEAGAAPPGSAGAIFIPALSGSMTPRWNDQIRGSFAGLSLDHGVTHLSRAILEGCAFALRDIVDRIEQLGIHSDRIRVVGGGARSDVWLQIKADVTGRAIQKVAGDHATSDGAAMLAGLAAGAFPDLDDAVARCVQLEPALVVPDPERASAYAEGYERYRRYFDAVEDWTMSGAVSR
jgi:xylulokinase